MQKTSDKKHISVPKDDITIKEASDVSGLAGGKKEKTKDYDTLLKESSFRTYNQSCDIFNGRLFYGFRYKHPAGDFNSFVFDDGTSLGGEDKLPFVCRSPLVFSPNQLSSDMVLRWKNDDIPQVDGKGLFEAIVASMQEYIELNKPAEYKLLALWIFQSYLGYQFGVTPYIHVNGQAGSGKSTIMRYSSKLAFKGWFVIKPSPSALFRFVDSNMCSVFFDEFESYTDAEKGDVFSVLNDGYVKDGQIPRVRNLPNGEYTVDMFNPYGAKMFSSVTDVRFGTFSSRCIEVYVLRTSKKFKDIVALSDAEVDFFSGLQNSLYLWHLQNWKKILKRYQEIEVPEFSGRALQILKPLLPYAEEFGVYDEIMSYYAENMAQRVSYDTEFDKDFLFAKTLHELVIINNDTQLTAERILDRYTNILKDTCGFIKPEFLPTKKSVGWKIRKLDVCKKIKRADGAVYDFSALILKDRLERYGYLKLLDNIPGGSISQDKTPEEVISMPS